MSEPYPQKTDAHPPRIVYDDECGFCTWCARFAARHGDFELVGFHELTPDQLARLPDDYEHCAHLLTDDAVYDCGASAEHVIRHLVPALDGVFHALNYVPGYAALRERTYRWAADRRALWGKLLRECPPAEDD
ncbi:thiol-disulfide oxidoreductase DCC family protein [Halocalculus aciditolerans]|uniref:Thiol-disulfide oxidoreductase n=1 Tax=Halocalculus aciditolerans TaxID=1383812 RepID=A0A830F7B4_9EURY|nr:DCC1-like thiol-disulfide oxidoreductase family protein [Halocalculus aciditolerans]GGL46536.1 thiol-disulfide oxidoreductase [Halocalculus aciditolerans]